MILRAVFFAAGIRLHDLLLPTCANAQRILKAGAIIDATMNGLQGPQIFAVGQEPAGRNENGSYPVAINELKETTMMNQVDEFNRARTRMSGDIKTVIADGEDLLKAAADVSGEGFAVAREKFAEKLGNARARLADASQAAVGTARRSAAAADGYVHGNPWTAIGIAGAAGLLIGFLAARR